MSVVIERIREDPLKSTCSGANMARSCWDEEKAAVSQAFEMSEIMRRFATEDSAGCIRLCDVDDPPKTILAQVLAVFPVSRAWKCRKDLAMRPRRGASVATTLLLLRIIVLPPF